MTEEDVGYLVMDVGSGDSAQAVEALKNIPETIRVRVLF